MFGHRTEVVEEDERTDAALARRGQKPPHLETPAEVLLVPLQRACGGHGCHPFMRAVIPATRLPIRRAVSRSPADMASAPASDGDCAMAPLYDTR
jgi:hypothetical protein